MTPQVPFSRRRFVTGSAAFATTLQLQRAAHALGFAPAAPVCSLNAEQEVGPYYVAGELLRSDIREGKPGIPLMLRLLVLDSRTCMPLPNAAMDVWHCDALGLYSGYTAQNPTGPGERGSPPSQGLPRHRPSVDWPPPGLDRSHPGPPTAFNPSHPGNHPGPPEGFGPPRENHPTDELTFLRGVQITGPDGAVTFNTVFPGFYMGRTNHIHFKVRLQGHTALRPGHAGASRSSTHPAAETYTAGHTSHTGQVFFPEGLVAELMTREPYRSHGIHRTTQAEDGIFTHQHGDTAIARLTPAERNTPSYGYHAELIAAVDPTATPVTMIKGYGPPPPSLRP